MNPTKNATSIMEGEMKDNDTQKAANDALDVMVESTRIRMFAMMPLRIAIWFLVPFLIVWGAGVSLEVAARVAVYPAACMTATGIPALLATVWSLRTLSKIAQGEP